MFIPGSRNPSDFDLAMRRSLADSLSYIYSETGAQLNLTESSVSSALDEIRAHRVKPGIFGRYYKLVLALQQENGQSAQQLFSDIVELSRDQPVFHVLPFTEQALGNDRTLYAELIDPNPQGVRLFDSPSPDQWADFPNNVSKALDIIQTADADLAKELRSVTVEIVCAAPPNVPRVRPFGSASSFMLWGALLMNVSRYNNPLELVEGLVHEAAHQLLFAHSIEEPLVTNSIDERYSSPLRADPRPMDGVFHATFVTARVHYVLQKIRMAISPTFAPVSIAAVDDRLQLMKGLYAGGLDVVQKHGKLTATGQQIIGETIDYMKAA